MSPYRESMSTQDCLEVENLRGRVETLESLSSTGFAYKRLAIILGMMSLVSFGVAVASLCCGTSPNHSSTPSCRDAAIRAAAGASVSCPEPSQRIRQTSEGLVCECR